ncbi:MAG: hypothetical protein J0H66_01290 [Solirubrobacterales bacterium]|nr:hypothetical protein [Solirubrobacterales bacterium]OJU95498.1 MAG: hypothetical protein BGO23_06600 [Solirubrobacterales bacterium 67-14]
MAVHPHRTAWTDERLDDLAQSVRDGFSRNDADHRLIRQEIREGFDRVDARFERVDARFDQMDSRFERIDARFERVDDRFSDLQISLSGQIARLQQTIIAGLVVIIGAMIGNGLGIF